MRLGIVGPRDLYVSIELIHEAISRLDINPDCIVTGDATGIDACAVRYAKSHGLPYDDKKADWNKHGKSAGPIRNREVVKESDVILAIFDRSTDGTNSTRRIAEEMDVPVYLCEVKR